MVTCSAQSTPFERPWEDTGHHAHAGVGKGRAAGIGPRLRLHGHRTTKLHHLEENVGSADVALRPEDLREIDRAASRIEVKGARYPEHLQKWWTR